MYKNNHAINPNTVIKVTKSQLTGKKKKEFLKYTKKYKDEIEVALNDYSHPSKEKSFDYIVSLEKSKEYIQQPTTN